MDLARALDLRKVDKDEILAALPEPLRLVFEATYFDGLGQVEAAEALDIPLGTVKSRVRQAKERVAEHLARIFPESQR
jgi:RNA polymerase sigma-70 factor (ECF subfamily)